MRFAFTIALLSTVAAASQAEDSPRPVGANCTLPTPPAEAGEESNHGMVLRVYPRARDIDASYSGCQAVFAEHGGKWVVMSLTEIVSGDPLRIWSEHDPNNPAFSCRYSGRRVVRGDPATCPAPQFLLFQSLPPGCIKLIRESITKSGLGAPNPPGCTYE
jgi:hypothetical protein